MMFYLFLFAINSMAATVQGPLALVYKGPGACEEGCSEAAAEMARLAGYRFQFVGPEESSEAIFSEAKVWIQPGGKSSTASRTMAPKLKENIRNFVSKGGGYVGFCAGGFLATDWIADRGVQGLGLLPGTNALFPDEREASILTIQWGGSYEIYFEGGPYFLPPTTPDSRSFEVTATYGDGKVASVRSVFGSGRVYVTGLHPEAPPAWRNEFQLQDSDGLDYALAVEMIHWVSGKPN
jgi:glutamine amidotransferase-like uncharacterized protein